MNWGEILDNTILPAVWDILKTIILFGIPVLSGIIINYIRKFFTVLRQKTNDEYIDREIDNISDTVTQIVHYIGQTYVDEIKGTDKWDRVAQEHAMLKSKEMARAMISDESQKFIANIYGDFNKWLETKIESVVRCGKHR